MPNERDVMDPKDDKNIFMYIISRWCFLSFSFIQSPFNKRDFGYQKQKLEEK